MMFEEIVTSGIVRCVVDTINQLTRKSNTNSYEIGVLIVKHTKGKSREYRSEFIAQILDSEELECSRSLVYDAYAVMTCFPDYTPEAPLSFSHHVELTRLETDSEREDFRRRAIKGGWSVRRLRAEVRAHLKSRSTMQDALEDCLGHIRRAWALLGDWREEIEGRISKGLVVSAGLVADNATQMAKEARSFFASINERWEAQLPSRKSEPLARSGGPGAVVLDTEDFRLVGVEDEVGCEEILFPKDNPRVSLDNVFKATKYLLQVHDLGDVKLQYRTGVWATHWNRRKRVIQFGEDCLEKESRDDGGSRVALHKRYQTKSGLERVALIVIHEVTHAVLDGNGGDKRHPHGREFRLRLDKIHQDRLKDVIAILENNGHSESDPLAPAEHPASTDGCDSSVDERR